LNSAREKRDLKRAAKWQRAEMGIRKKERKKKGKTREGWPGGLRTERGKKNERIKEVIFTADKKRGKREGKKRTCL